MMERDKFRLGHILECAHKIEMLVSSVEKYEVFEQRWIEQDAMIRNLEVIGEAANHISEELKQRSPKIQWFKIRGMRNLVAHEYFGITLRTIWNTAIYDIPILKEQIQKILATLK